MPLEYTLEVCGGRLGNRTLEAVTPSRFQDGLLVRAARFPLETPLGIKPRPDGLQPSSMSSGSRSNVLTSLEMIGADWESRTPVPCMASKRLSR